MTSNRVGAPDGNAAADLVALGSGIRASEQVQIGARPTDHCLTTAQVPPWPATRSATWTSSSQIAIGTDGDLRAGTGTIRALSTDRGGCTDQMAAPDHGPGRPRAPGQISNISTTQRDGFAGHPQSTCPRTRLQIAALTTTQVAALETDDLVAIGSAIRAWEQRPDRGPGHRPAGGAHLRPGRLAQPVQTGGGQHPDLGHRDRQFPRPSACPGARARALTLDPGDDH